MQTEGRSGSSTEDITMRYVDDARTQLYLANGYVSPQRKRRVAVLLQLH